MSLANPTRLIGGLILASAFTAFAPSVTVHYDDLNLEANTDAKALVNRIASAGATVCGGKQSSRPFARNRQQYAMCSTNAVRAAVAKVDHPLVTAIFENQEPKSKRLASR